MQTFWDKVLRVVAVVGLIAVLLLGAWGIIQIAFMLPSFFGGLGGSLFGRNTATTQETLTVSVPAAVTAQKPFTVTWRHSGAKKASTYTVSYACAEGLTIAAPTPSGQHQAVQCNTPFNYTSASSSVELIAVLADGSKNTQTTFTVVANTLDTKERTASGAAGTTVSPAATTAKPTTTTKPKSTGSTYYPSGRTANLYGYPDLAVTVLSAQSTGGNATVQFSVSNIGTNVTPTNWTLQAQLPSGYMYPAGPQQALYPGDKIVYTLRYSEEQTTGYSNPCTGWSYPCQPTPTTYGGPGTCNAYGPCAVPGYAAIPYNYNPYTQTAPGYNGSWFFGGQRTVNITVDPYNALAETTKYNNTVSHTYIAY